MTRDSLTPSRVAVVADPTVATPVLEFLTANQTASEGVAAIIYDPHDGHRELHFFFDQASWYHQLPPRG